MRVNTHHPTTSNMHTMHQCQTQLHTKQLQFKNSSSHCYVLAHHLCMCAQADTATSGWPSHALHHASAPRPLQPLPTCTANAQHENVPPSWDPSTSSHVNLSLTPAHQRLWSRVAAGVYSLSARASWYTGSKNHSTSFFLAKLCRRSTCLDLMWSMKSSKLSHEP